MKQMIEDRISPRSSPCRDLGHRPEAPARPSMAPQPEQGHRARLAQHSHIFREGDSSDRIYQVIEGAVMLYKLLPDGRRQVVELLGPGDVFGLTDSPQHECSAETLVAGCVRVFDRAAVESSPQLLRSISHCLRVQICALHEHAVLLGRKSALERLASFLLRCIPDRGGIGCKGPLLDKDTANIRLRMTRQEIADYLGLTIETVSRAFSELRRRGLVTTEKIDEVLVKDVCAICRLTGAH